MVSAGGGTGVKTLVVEDSATLCAIYAQYLDGSGLEVNSVETLSAARESLAKADVQMVLLDIELPDGNGLDLIDDLQRLSPQPAVVMMTGHGADYAEEAIARGEYPINVDRISDALMHAYREMKG